MPSFKKSLIVEQFQGNYLKVLIVRCSNIKVMNKKEMINLWKGLDC